MAVVYGTERLEVRLWAPGEAEVAYDIYRRWEVARWLGADPRPAESVDAMRATIGRWAARELGAFGIWAIVPCDTGGPVGTVLLVPLQDAEAQPVDEIEVGWALHPDHWGHGYATEAAAGALARGWAAGLDEIYAVVHPGNDPSVAVTDRLGMAPVGRTKRWYGVELDAFRIARPGG